LCRQINADSTPSYVAISAEPGCEANDCFECIRQKVEREGGRIQFGWSIWEWPHVYVEAEHHAIYEPPGGGTPRDITPSADPQVTRRLFLPDDSATYDFENEGVLRDNRRLALVDDPLVREFFAAAEKRLAILNSIPGVGTVEVDPNVALALQAAEMELAGIVHRLGMKYTPQNARCFCGSGEKFKRCCGRPRKGFR
jgi:hypothetical protein